jgi:hypothetical protein
MKKYLMWLVFRTLFVSLRILASQPNLELSAFVTVFPSGEGYLSLRITNRDESEVIVLTENFTHLSLGGYTITGSGRYRSRSVSLNFDILTIDSEKLIPSLPKLGPVILRKGDTAASGVKLDANFIDSLRNWPDQVIRIQYSIGEKLAERHGLWHGTIEIEKVASSLLPRQDNQQKDTTTSNITDDFVE